MMDVPKEQRQQQMSFPANFSDLPTFFLSRWRSLSEYGKGILALLLIVCAASTYLFNSDKKVMVFTTASTLLISLYQVLQPLENRVLAAEKKNNCK